MTFELNAEFTEAVKQFRDKYGDEAVKEALQFYLVGVGHAGMLVAAFQQETSHQLIDLLERLMAAEN